MSAAPPPRLPPVRARRLAGAAALLLLSAIFTWGAVTAFPLWDDGWLWLLLREEGSGAIGGAFADRPANAWLWSALAAGGERTFWSGAFAAQALLWPLLGGLAAWLWTTLFPADRRWAWAAGLLAVAPFATVVQMVTANVALASLLPAALGWGAVLLAMAWVEIGGETRRPTRALLLAAAPVLLAAGVLLQEYALPPVAAALALLAGRAVRGTGRVRRRAAGAALLLLLAAGASYTLFLSLADREARDDVQLEHALSLEHPPAWYATTLGGSLGRAWLAAPAARVAELAGRSTAAWAVGVALAALVVFSAGGRRRAPASRAGSAPPAPRSGLPDLLVATALALAPAVVMGRVPWDPADGMASRFGIPALPLVGALILRTLLLVPPRAARLALVALLTLAGGAAAVDLARDAAAERRRIGELGAALRPHAEAAAGHTVAVLPLAERELGPRRQWELVVRLGARWPDDLRRRLWAHRYGGAPPLYYREEATVVFGERDRCRPPRRLRKRVRGVTRWGPLDRLLWVEPTAEGARIEPYCR